MRWPFVSRRAYDDVKAMKNVECENYKALFKEYRDLLDKYHALKVQGAAVPEGPRDAKPIDPVSAAITQAAGHDPKLRALMAREAMRMRAAQFPDHEIVDAIQNGVTSMEGLPA